jgi:hypothetical protein
MNKKNLTLIGLLIILIVAYKLSQTKEKIEKQIAFFKADSTSIASFKIYNKDDTLKISKIGADWKMVEPVNYPANVEKVKELIKLISTIKTSNIPIAESKNSFEKYKSVDSLGTNIILYDKNGKEIEHAIVSRGKEYNKNYARHINKSKIYLLDKTMMYQITPNIGNWRDSKIFAYPKDTIEEVAVTYKLNKYKLINADSTWKYIDSEKKFNIPSKNIHFMQLFNRLKNTTTHVFVDNQFEKYKTFFENPDLEVKIKLKNGVKTYFKIAKVDKNKFLLMRENETKTLFNVAAPYIDRFTIDANHFQSN